jgi:hypothetical protein
MNSTLKYLVALLLASTAAAAFIVPTSQTTTITLSKSNSSYKRTTTTVLQMANDEDLKRWDKSSRSAGATDNVVTLLRPLGLVLAEDANKNVFVETVAPRGNAARTGQVSACTVQQYCRKEEYRQGMYNMFKRKMRLTFLYYPFFPFFLDDNNDNDND